MLNLRRDPGSEKSMKLLKLYTEQLSLENAKLRQLNAKGRELNARGRELPPPRNGSV